MKRSNPRYAGFSLAGTLLIALGLGAGSARASVSIYMPPEQLAEQATLIVEGRVSRTASGLDPQGGSLATYVTLDVTYVHRGPRELSRLVLREPGGRFGELVHEVDAVPAYRVGERVLAFLEAGPDGALRTTGMFFGKFELDETIGEAVRDLDGQGRIFGRPVATGERFRLDDLVAIAAAPRRTARPARRAAATASAEEVAWRAEPVEWTRLQWDDVHEGADPVTTVGAAPASARDLAANRATGTIAPTFAPASTSQPSRWQQSDSGTAISVNIQPLGNPLGSPSAAVAEMQRAMDAWNAVPESRVTIQAGNTAYNYTASHSQSPAQSYSGTNVILFDDPYGDISDPVNCSGVLAIGGYWRSGSTGTTINNVTFYRALQLYVIFNNNFQCFLGNPDALAEVAAHELGHGLGFGHSTAPDAIMRSTAYGGSRGPRLGNDDRDAAHCHYPHVLTLLSPNGGESWTAGASRAIQWNATPEPGVDPGQVDLELSTNGGSSWTPLATGQTNDGHHDWIVSNTPSANVRLRVVRHHRAGAAPAGYPATCSGDGSDGSFTIAAAPITAGSVPDGANGSEPVLVQKIAAGVLRLQWDAACSQNVENYAVYEGDLDLLRGGIWNHVPVNCFSGSALAQYISYAPGDRYFLVAPGVGSVEGRYGSSSSGVDRPASESACGIREAQSTCP